MATKAKVRKRYNRASLDDTMDVAIQNARHDGTTRYVVATALGYSIELRKPAFGRHYVVTRDGVTRAGE